MQPVLESYLASPRWRVRWSAVDGIATLYAFDWSKLLPLLDDPHANVRAAVCRAAWSAEHTVNSWAIGDPEVKHATPFPDEHVARLRAMLRDKACAQFVKNFLSSR
jgi:HEAT repeat protein